VLLQQTDVLVCQALSQAEFPDAVIQGSMVGTRTPSTAPDAAHMLLVNGFR